MAVMLLMPMAAPQSHAADTALTLPGKATTSAGIFDADDRLVRTLWSGRPQPAGRLVIHWDGLDDDGNVVPATGKYLARVAAHNVRYVWEGVIGNTSRDATGERIHRAFGPVNDMAVDAAGTAFYVVGYNEQQSAIHRFSMADTRRQQSLAHDDYLRTFRYTATDGALAYFANVGGESEPESFVIALQVADGTEYRFATGKLVMPGQRSGNRWESVIDYRRTKDIPSGLAVQRRGSLLFVAHRASDEIRVYDKRSGELLQTIEVSQPGDMDVATDDSLWVICRVDGRKVVMHYRQQGSRWEQADQVSGGLVDPVAVGVSPVDGTVLVADAGSEQLKAFNRSGKALWTLGRSGGYRSGGPEVRNDRFWLSAGPTYVAFDAQGSFWFGDPGNFRNLRFSAQREYLDRIMYLPATYVVTADPADPTRVFARFLEFKVDYARPIGDSWTLVRNWGVALERRYFGLFDGLQAVHTLSNGRSYGVLRRADDGSNDIFELTAFGLRATGTRLRAGEWLYADGSLRFHSQLPGNQRIYVRPLIGFDAQGNPRWEPPVLRGSVSGLKDVDPYYHDVPEVAPVNGVRYPDTASGLIVSFSPGRSQGFHLGAILPGREGWLWRASPSGSWQLDEEGEIVSRDGRYELGRGVQYPGNRVVTSGRHIVYGYHGEAWNGGQANQWMHFLDNGLFIGQFGRPNYPGNNRTFARPETAGNAFSPQLVKKNGVLYLWHNDEGVHNGVHRWRIDDIDTLHVIEAPIKP